ncbi:DNA polymerase III subunit chi [Nitrosococcus watsonii]|uniref:DNA polymerase III chi subunit HolC n=1 Tax=Nitrosococcus watsoni (strain C-113) TaxID=105559 RepID=D8K9R8_NITWC|nr:DNA polymerase III subunit chi [Nitrosococcus watsonii]ADJ27357.1 DNA polymerase III chi subunit HolC [Nitrosococcus watsonii C-113]
MTKVDFYLLTSHQPQASKRFACKLTEKAYRLGHQIYIQTENQAQAQEMDELLWTFRQGSFVPHALINSEEADESPVLIGYEREPEGKLELLINLCAEVPAFFSRFQRVAEIIGQDENHRHAGRQRYRYYRDHGCLLETHELNF